MTTPYSEFFHRVRCRLGIHNRLTRKLARNWVNRPGYYLRCRDCGKQVRP